MTLYKDRGALRARYQVVDEEKVAPGDLYENREEEWYAADNAIAGIKSEKLGRADIFSWKNIQCEVLISARGIRKLLDNVSGYVAPGMLTALMGEAVKGQDLRCSKCWC